MKKIDFYFSPQYVYRETFWRFTLSNSYNSFFDLQQYFKTKIKLHLFGKF